MLTVGQVAAEFGVTVRTLHHYDEVGLLEPAERSPAGYRLYTDDDLTRLRQVVAYRRLGFSLEEVAAVLAADSDVLSHLHRQRDAVRQRRHDLDALAHALDRALEAEVNGYQISKDEQREIFGESFSDEYAEEAEARWGESAVWAQSRSRTKHYTKEQWQQVKDETDQINGAFIVLMASGASADSPEAMDVAERARLQIHRWFYDCSPAMHDSLANLYVTDPRFTATYEDQAHGLARYVHDAIKANGARQG